MHSDTKPSSDSAKRPDRLTRSPLRRSGRLAALLASVAALVAGCKSPPAPTTVPGAVLTPETSSSQGATSGQRPGQPPGTQPGLTGTAPVRPSGARTPKEYRLDAATHLYELNANRIFKGRMPPMLYAVGVLQIEMDRRGNILSTHWLRAPRHAPEVVAEIERTVRSAAPYPAPERLGKVTYTDTWLWDQSGRFQLDTLTEGQD